MAAWGVLSLAGCSRQSPEDARALLEARNIPFNNFEFVRSAAYAPPAILALFINGNMHPSTTTGDGYTALMVAAQAGNLPNVMFLLNEGASVRPRANGGITALMMAAQECRHPEVIRLLLEAGSQANEEADDGSTALTFASPPAVLGGVDCEPDVIRRLVKAGSDPNHVNHQGWTPLGKAIVNGSLANVAALLELGANPDRKTGEYEWPPLLAAARQPYQGESMFRALLKAGADPNATDKFNQSVLFWTKDNVYYSNALLQAGAKPLPAPTHARDLQITTYPVPVFDSSLPIDCKTFQKALNLTLPCYGELH